MNRPSPVVVRIYQLKDDAAFKHADFFALYDKQEATLSTALISREEYELSPEERRTTNFTLSPETHFLGVAAAYRDIRNAQWRALLLMGNKVTINAVKDHQLIIAIGRSEVRITDSD